MVSTAWRGRSYPNEVGAEGTGFDPPVFSFPIRSRLTIHTYYDQFVAQVTLATRFFTWMTSLMIATSIVMLISEWEHYGDFHAASHAFGLAAHRDALTTG
jgi:hypothetical protein